MNNNCNQFWNEYEHEVREWLPNDESKSLWFFRDGIVCQDKYGEDGFHPLFIFKEVNDHEKNGCNGCEKHKICQSASICVCNEESKYIDFTRCNDIQECKGMWKKTSDLEHTLEEIYGVQPSKGLTKAAIINLKKISGGGTASSESSMKTLHYACHATKFQEKLRTQIECIKPTIIICCGSFDGIYEKKENSYLGLPCKERDQEKQLIGISSSRQYSIMPYWCTVSGKDVPLINSYHPAAPFLKSDESWTAFSKVFRSVIIAGGSQ